MKKEDAELLYSIALLAFQPDYDKYGVFPPLLKLKQEKFMPPLTFGKAILADGVVVGGAFVMAFGRKGVLGSIFLDPQQQKKGYGRQAIQMIEKLYPKVRRWKLDTPAGSYGLHRFYESLGYVKTGEMQDRKSGFKGFVYEKTIEM